jgi:uncharacterized protein (TIGR03435 family)
MICTPDIFISRISRAVVVLVIALVPVVSWSQARFEVAVVRPRGKADLSVRSVVAPNGDINGGPAYDRDLSPSGLLRISNISIPNLLTLGFGVRDDAIIGVPKELDDERFDVQARAPAKTTWDGVRPMLAAMMKEQFGLVAHMDSRVESSFVLTRGKRPLGITRAGAGPTNCTAPPPVVSGGRVSVYMTCTNMTMAKFAELLPRLAHGDLDKTVVDRTQLDGGWNLDFETIRDRDINSGTTVFGALEKVGLHLEEKKASVPVLIVDHIERPRIQ